MYKKLFVLGVIAFAIVLGIYFALPNKEDVQEPVLEEVSSTEEVIGTSIEGRDIESFTFGYGEDALLFIGGIHGGYEWNTVLLAYEVIDYLKEYKEVVPENITVHVIPSVNPDGLYKVTGKEGIFTASDVSEDTVPGRFNANEVDLNRNFDCKWSADGVWRGNKVNTGEGPFSEKESQVIRDYVLEIEPKAVIFWHSQAGAVYGSECFSGILPDTLNIMNLYAKAAGYDAVPFFDAYPVHGDSEGWLASIDIPAITVELQTHSDVEFDRNIKGLKALLEYYKN